MLVSGVSRGLRRFGPIVCLLASCATCFLTLAAVTPAGAQAQETVSDPATLQTTRQKGIDYLRTKQSDDGSWTSATVPGISGLILESLLRSGVKVDDPMIQKGLKHLESFIQPDGGIYFPKGHLRNYETCIAILVFHSANSDGKYTEVIKKADKFIRQQQWDEEEGKKPEDLEYGGSGYGSKSRPDLSNTQFLLDALNAAGAKADDPAVQKALIFVSRSQNLESEANTTPFSSKVNDGGFYYTPAGGGSSVAGTTENGGLRSYGSMTYAGLKSMVFAGLKPNDPRVKAATTWIKKHYSVSENPGLDQAGLYYYYITFSKALDAVGEDVFEDMNGKKHNWRNELVAQLAKNQNSDGSWVNKVAKWNEGDPNMTTGFALLALSYCNPPQAGK